MLYVNNYLPCIMMNGLNGLMKLFLNNILVNIMIMNIFSNIKVIGAGAFGKVFRANWKHAPRYFALKSFFNLDTAVFKEIVQEVIYLSLILYFGLIFFRVVNYIIFIYMIQLKHQREVDFHENIIRFYGITTKIKV